MAAKSYKPGWYAVRATNGSLVVIRHDGNGPINLGTGLKAAKVASLNWTQNSLEQLPSTVTIAAFKKVGATVKQQDEYMVQYDTAAVKTGLTELVIPLGGKPTASLGHQPVSTKPSGDAQAESLGIGWPSLFGGLESAIEFLTSASNWKRVGQVLLGGILILMGLRTLSGHTVTPATVVSAPAKAAKKVVVSKVA